MELFRRRFISDTSIVLKVAPPVSLDETVAAPGYSTIVAEAGASIDPNEQPRKSIVDSRRYRILNHRSNMKLNVKLPP
jgi:hypothetical protein